MRSKCRVLALAILAGACAAGCAPHKPAAVAPAEDRHGPDRLAAADALLWAGCLDCLTQALEAYRSLRDIPDVARAAGLRAAETAALITIRETELSVPPSDTHPDAAVPVSGPERDEYLATLAAQADDGALAAYLWVRSNCGPRADFAAVSGRLAELGAWRDAPLVLFRLATCVGEGTSDRLAAVLQREPRFQEVHFLLGRTLAGQRQLDASLLEFQQALEWRQNWPTLTGAMADVFERLEDYERAAEFFGRTLKLDPDTPSAMLGEGRTLTILGRFSEAIVPLDHLVALRTWYPGDAHYWRAYDEEELDRNDEAWEDVELAAGALVNAAVPKLAGIVAYKRAQLDTARARLELARRRDASDCITSFYLGLVESDQQVWTEALDNFTAAESCFDREARQLAQEIETLRASDAPPERKAQQIARRDQARVADGRLQRTAWFNLAVGCYHLSRAEEARGWAGRVLDDADLGARARELIAQIK